MNNIDDMPPKCRDCPYWEFANHLYACWDCERVGYKYALHSGEECYLEEQGKELDGRLKSNSKKSKSHTC